MPIAIEDTQAIRVGEIYEDSYSHPCFCVEVNDQELKGISLVDGSYPRVEDLKFSKIRKLSATEAWHWRLHGPSDKSLDMAGRWWERNKPAYLINPATRLDNLYFFALYQVEWNAAVQEHIGVPILHQWHDIDTKVFEQENAGRAEIRFTVKGRVAQARVTVMAIKSNSDWLIENLKVAVPGNEISLVNDGKTLA